jgi:hypothetical protein
MRQQVYVKFAEALQASVLKKQAAAAQLRKQAAPVQPGMLGKAVAGVKRFAQLLGGGNKALVGDYRALQSGGTSDVINSLKSGKLREALGNLRAKGSIARLAYDSKQSPALASELRKSLLARLGVGTALAGGAAAALPAAQQAVKPIHDGAKAGMQAAWDEYKRSAGGDAQASRPRMMFRG